MNKSLQETLNHARTYLAKKEFIEGFAVLEGWSDDIPEIELMRQEIEDARIAEIDTLLKDAEEAQRSKEWQVALDLIGKAEALDGSDSKVRSAAERLRDIFTSEQKGEEVDKKMASAKALLERPGKSIEDLDTAVRLLEEVISGRKGEFEAESLLNDAQRMRGEFLKSIGQIATLEQTGEFEEALKEVNDLIQRNLSEISGKNIYEVRSQLEKKVREFAEQKAAKYLKKAEDALKQDNNPRLAMRYIDTGLALPGIPKVRRDAFNDLKEEVILAVEKFKEVDEEVKKARRFIDKQEYETAISKLEEALAGIPNHIEAQTFLSLARQGLKDRIVKNARVVIARVESGLNKHNFKKSREELLTVFDSLEVDGDHVETLRTRIQEILQQINHREQVETELKETVDRAQQALKDNKLDAAQAEIEGLGKELQNRPEVIRIRTALTREQGIDDALEKVRQALEEDNLHSAEKQIAVLKRRARDHQEVDNLHKEIKATVQLKKGIDYFNNGNIKEARRAFNRVIAIDSLHTEEAREYLQRIETWSEQDRKSKQLYNEALKHCENKSYREAYALLDDIEDVPSSLKKEIKTLRSSVRNKWRALLTRQIRSCLKNKAYDDIFDLADDLKKVRGAEDSKLLNDSYKSYHIHQAEIAEKRQHWQKAYEQWQEAQKYDAADNRINLGLKRAKKEKTFREAASCQNEQEVLRILEDVIERGDHDLTDLDYKIEERLYHAYLLSEEFSRALMLAGMRLDVDAKFSTKAKGIRDLCSQLNEAKEKFQIGAYSNSIDILEQCRKTYPEYSGILQTLHGRRKEQVGEILLDEARRSEINAESEVHILSKYRELLHILPYHREASQRYELLLTRFKSNVEEIVRDAISAREDENLSIEEIDALVDKIRELMRIADENRKTRLEQCLESLTLKRHTQKSLNKKLTQIEAFLTEAKETGDFKIVERELNEIVNIASQKNRKYSNLIDKIRDMRERRDKCEVTADEIKKAFETSDFSGIERLVDDLKRLDRDDEFFIQRRQLKLEDTYSHQTVTFGEMKEWARIRRQNLDKINTWYTLNKVDTTIFETEEKQLRRDVETDFDDKKFANGLLGLARKYRNALEPLITPPESPMSLPAKETLEKTEKLTKELGEKERQLKEEARMLLDDVEKVDSLVELASDSINKGNYAHARIHVEEGLRISPTHKILRYYRGVIENAL